MRAKTLIEIFLLSGIIIMAAVVVFSAARPDNSHLDPIEPDTRPRIDGVCEQCNLILPNAEVSRIRFCEGHEADRRFP